MLFIIDKNERELLNKEKLIFGIEIWEIVVFIFIYLKFLFLK